MANYGIRVPKSEAPEKTPYTVYYPHSKPIALRNWNQGWYQVASIDPARKNYALRIEKRFHDDPNNVQPIVFDKVSIESKRVEEGITICDTYKVLTDFLNKYLEFFKGCHFIIIERQIVDNYQAVRISQHTISYFSIVLADQILLPSIIEVDPKLKGRMLGAPKGISSSQLKSWAVQTAHKILNRRNDDYSLGVLKYFSKKQDDLSDTICQIEAIFILWGLASIDVDSLNTDPLLKPNTPVPNNNNKLISM